METIKELFEMFDKGAQLKDTLAEKGVELEHIDIVTQMQATAKKINDMRDIEVEAFTDKIKKLEEQHIKDVELSQGLLLRLSEDELKTKPKDSGVADDPNQIFKNFAENLS